MILRSLHHRRALAAGVILTLATGVAALTTAFGLLDAGMLRAPPFREAGRLAMLYLVRHPEGEPSHRERWSFRRFELLGQTQRSFERVASYSLAALTLSGDDDAELIRGELTSASYLPLLRVSPERGRLFGRTEGDAASPAPVALLSHDLWSRRWAGDPALIGKPIRVNGVALTVIGILPHGFHGLSGQADIWIPNTMAPQLTYPDYLRTNQNFISAVGRLRDGVTLAAAQSELAVLGANLNRAAPSDEQQPLEPASAVAVPLNQARMDPVRRRSLWVLLGAVALLHLLALANVINLLLGRAARQHRQAAVRLALGSSPRRLFGRLLAQEMGVALPGGLLGVGLAWASLSVLVPPVNVWSARNFYGSVAAFDAPSFGTAELAFGIVLALLTTLVVALPPALTAFGIDVQSGIKAGSRGMTTGAIRLRRPGARGLLLALETGLAVLLVLSAGLLLDSFRRMRRTPLGVETEHVLTFWVVPSEVRVPPAAAGGFVTSLLDAMSRIPGVVSASVDGGLPLSGTARGLLYVVGRPVPPENAAPPILRHYVAPAHFRTLGIPLLRGREFRTGDAAGAPKVTIISETAARRFWPGEDPLGKRVWFEGASAFGSPDSSAEIIGIVGDVVYEPLDRDPNRASFYTPYTQFTYATRAVFLRTTMPPLSLVPAVRQALRSVDPDVAMREIQTLDEVAQGSWARSRFEALLFGGFGAAAMLLAASGIFAVLAYVVSGRTREFGVRMALGADARRLVTLVLGEGLAFPLLGMAAGTVAALAVTRLLRQSLYQISPLDPGVFASTLALLFLAAVCACLVPAWRAARSDPVDAIRAE